MPQVFERTLIQRVAKLGVLTLLAACEPELVVGAWSCSPSDASVADGSAPLELPWATGFESAFCDYERVGGFCYAAPLAQYEAVTAPVHSGRYAAAFRIRAGRDDGYQTRCVREGILPSAAYYGAWYLIPEPTESTALWNLLHFRGGDATNQHGLWDVSLEHRSDGALTLFVFDFLHGIVRRADRPVPVPIGTWFHVELYLRRAPDATGEVALYQDGQTVLEARNLMTDDTARGQWYVGNLANGLTPPDSVLYVDDVTIRASR